MMCERCQSREATVHHTVVIKSSAEPTTHHYCETCYPAAEAVGRGSSNPPRCAPAPLTLDVEHITAREYLEAQDRARKRESDKPVYQRLLNELERYPKTRSRLAFELLELAEATLERGDHPGFLIAASGNFWGSADPERPKEYATLVEKLMRRIFELLRPSAAAEPVGESSVSGLNSPLLWSLAFAALALKKASRSRYAAVLKALKSEGDKAGADVRRRVLAQVEDRLKGIEKNRG